MSLGFSFAAGADWPNWRGPDYNGISSETTGWNPAGLKDGIKPLWQASVGTGFSCFSITGGRVYTMGNINNNDIIYCFDAVSGKEIWKYSYAEPLEPKYYEGGPGSTPTVNEGKVYTLSKTGRVFCLDAESGTVIWQKNYGVKPPTWGFAGSALVQDDRVIFNIGDRGIAVNKNDGSVIWQNGNGPSGYATPVPFVQDSGRCAVIFGTKFVSAVDTATGKEVWQYQWETQYDVNAADPLISGKQVFITSGYNRGCAVFNPAQSGTETVWTNKNMRSQMSGPVLIDGYLYGIDDTQLNCIDFKTGQVKWTAKEVGKGSLMAAGDKLIVIGEKGTLYIAQASPDSFKVISSAAVLTGKCWTMPVLANGLIYARNAAGNVVCLDVRSKKTESDTPKPAISASADWPQWRGPNRDGKSMEKGLLKSWPEGGPKMLWSVQGLGGGFSTVSIAEGLIYTTGRFANEGKLFAFDLDGNKKWEITYGTEWTKAVPGVRGTPTINGGNLYLISGVGKVYCFDAKSGSEKWSVDAFEQFSGSFPSWGISESPLIDGNKVFFTVGGGKATMIALDKSSGRVIWASPGTGEKSAYGSPVIIERGGRKLVVNMTESSVIGVDSADGGILWRYDISEYVSNNRKTHPTTPIYQDGCVYVNSGYDMGGIKLSVSEDGTKVTKVWSDKTLDTHHGCVVLVDGCLYGSNWLSNATGKWVCLDWNTGKAVYETDWNGKGSLTCADGMLYCYDEKQGMVGLVSAEPKGFDVISSFKVPLGENEHWAHPVVCGGRLYIRHGDALMVYDIRGS